VTNAVARAVTRAILLVKNDPDAAKRATRPFLKELDQATFDAAWATYLPDMPTSPDISAESFAKELKFEAAVLPAGQAAPVPYEAVVDASFVRRAMRELAP
jgi:ABC-type nitrate/sulfonate/bicarbonate transport system substrate-binding protein